MYLTTSSAQALYDGAGEPFRMFGLPSGDTCEMRLPVDDLVAVGSPESDNAKSMRSEHLYQGDYGFTLIVCRDGREFDAIECMTTAQARQWLKAQTVVVLPPWNNRAKRLLGKTLN